MSKKTISKTTIGTRLFTKDEKHINHQVKSLRFINPNFKDNSSALRYYVQLGIAYEKGTETANTLDDKIIKSSQKEVVRSELDPLKNSIDSLIGIIKEMNQNNDTNFQEVLKSQDITNLKLDSISDQLTQNLLPLLKIITKSERLNLHSLRNIIILRSVLFVFLMAQKTGRIDPDKITDWQKIIKFAHSQAEELSDEELKQIESESFETSVVETLAHKLFNEIKRHQIPNITK